MQHDKEVENVFVLSSYDGVISVHKTRESAEKARLKQIEDDRKYAAMLAAYKIASPEEKEIMTQIEEAEEEEEEIEYFCCPGIYGISRMGVKS